jgi:hypothetical protein
MTFAGLILGFMLSFVLIYILAYSVSLSLTIPFIVNIPVIQMLAIAAISLVSNAIVAQVNAPYILRKSIAENIKKRCY